MGMVIAPLWLLVLSLGLTLLTSLNRIHRQMRRDVGTDSLTLHLAALLLGGLLAISCLALFALPSAGETIYVFDPLIRLLLNPFLLVSTGVSGLMLWRMRRAKGSSTDLHTEYLGGLAAAYAGLIQCVVALFYAQAWFNLFQVSYHY